MKKCIIFDLDRTLLNLNYTEHNVLSILLKEHVTEEIEFVDFFKVYKIKNDAWWRKRSNNSATLEEIKINRFKDTFEALKIVPKISFKHFSDDYSLLAKTNWKLHDGAFELLSDLKSKYSLALITNGFSETQNHKLDFIKIKHFFAQITISDEVNLAKPQAEIFYYTINKCGVTIEQSLYIGDDEHDDVIGAKNAGLDVIWFNEHRIKNNHSITDVFSFEELDQHLRSRLLT